MSYSSQLQQKFFSLQKSLQDAIRSEENNVFLVNIAKKYMLNDDQQMDLIHTSAYVLLGEISRADFGRHIANIEGVGERAAQAIAQTIDEKLFVPLAKEIDEALRDRISTDAVESPDQESGTKEQEAQREGVAFVPPETSTQQKWRMPREAPIVASAPDLSTEPEDEVTFNKPTQQKTEELTNSQTSEPTAPETHQLINSQTHKLAEPETHQLTDSPTDELADPQTDEQLAPDVITIPTITITKPPRFIPLKDLKQGSIKSRPAPQGVPSRDTIPNFSSATPRTTPRSSPQDAIHTLKNDVAPTPTPTPASSVLPRIEPTPEKLASSFVAPQPQKSPSSEGGSSVGGNPPTTPSSTPRTPSNDPYHEPIDDTQGKPIDDMYGEPSRTAQGKPINTP